MKLLNLFLFVAIFTLSATNSYSQNEKVYLNKKNVKLEEVLSDIEKQTDYLFIYNDQVKVDQKVTVAAEGEATSTVLNNLLKGTDIKYRMQGTHIVLTKEAQIETINTAKQVGTKPIAGAIVDKHGEPLIGVSVVIKGTTKGTTTDLDGNFTIDAGNDDILEISYVGFTTQDIKVGNQSSVTITLLEKDVLLGDVVVTALGIKKETKALTYNVQKIDTEQITTVKDANFINSLAGKIAGVNINQSASGIGGSTRIVMRGTKSLFGNNNALYVIDGVPIFSIKNDQPESFYESPDGGDIDPMSFINADDIADISILTGAASAALYGSQGANGVILITTKKGEEGKLRVSYSNNSQFMKPFVMPEFQDSYGSKNAGVDFNSWGAKGDAKAYDPKDFFQTGFTETNSLSVSSGSETNQTYLSYSNMQARGIIPENELSRNNLNLRNSTDLIKNKLILDLAVTYTRQKDQNMTTQGQYHNPLLPIYLFPRGDDINKFKTYEHYSLERNFDLQNWTYGNQALGMQNPYWIVNREKFENKTDRYSFTGSLKYNILDWLNVTGRMRMDNTENTYTRKISASADLLFASENGYYMNRKRSDKQIYADLLASMDKKFMDDKINLTATIGASIMDAKGDMSGLEGFLSMAPNVFKLSNIDLADAQSKPIQSDFHEQTQAIFATMQIGYKSLVYLDLTARNEWASTLAFTKNGTSFFYPSVGLSGVLSDIFQMPKNIIPFMKVRASYSEVGNAPIRYVTRNSYEISTPLKLMPFHPADGLKPEKTKAFEIGTNIRLLQDKINLDVTYYNSNTFNQLFKIEAGPSSKYSYLYLNAGKVNNWGVEIALGYKDKFGPLEWRSNLTYTLNRNKVKELVPEGTVDPTTGESMARSRFTVNQSGTYRMELREGQPMGDIYVSTLRKDHNGYTHVDSESGEVVADPNNWIKAGNVNPKYNLGWNNSFHFKGFDLSFLIDARVGGVGVSATQALMDRYGVSAASARARDDGGVLVNGGRLNPENYYAVVGGGTTGVLSEYVYSSTNVRLRELSLGYTFPSKWFKGYIDNLSVSVIAKNLWMIYNRAPYDPEITASTGTYYQGFDYFMQPSTRSIGFGLKVQF